jgi:hypothetical protein
MPEKSLSSGDPAVGFPEAVRETQPTRRCCARPAALLPYPASARRRPVALRPTLSSGLPLTGFSVVVSKPPALAPPSSMRVPSACKQTKQKPLFVLWGIQSWSDPFQRCPASLSRLTVAFKGRAQGMSNRCAILGAIRHHERGSSRNDAISKQVGGSRASGRNLLRMRGR